MRTSLLGLGLVAIVEGLVLALAPAQLRAALETIARHGPERRRALGLLAVTAGIALVWAGAGVKSCAEPAHEGVTCAGGTRDANG